MNTSHDRRDHMVATQIAARGVHDEAVLRALRTVPREAFVPATLAEFAYEDTPLPIEEGQTISQPYIVALMVEALGLDPGDRVLEIGAGSGYAAAVLSRIAREVYAVERLAVLADNARDRCLRLDYDNVRVLCADGTQGWLEHAPYDAILVSAGGPEVPDSLLRQLRIGGTLVIPVGRDLRSQELLRIQRVDEHEYSRESLGAVQFVPLIGTEGWSADGVPLGHQRARKPLRVTRPERTELAPRIAAAAEPFDDPEEVDLRPLLERIGDARVVLIGEASHGTSEFYLLRERITRELIGKKKFNVVALEGDYPDVNEFDRYVRVRPGPELRSRAFARFPSWMWRNREVRGFLDWLWIHNHEWHTHPERQTAMVGLDLYSLNNSIGAVLDYLDLRDPQAALEARTRYACFSPWEMDPAVYGRAAASGRLPGCEREAVTTLRELLRHRLEYLRQDGEEFFSAERNASVIRDAEQYYRIMFRGSRESWNLRDRHMFDTLLSVLEHRGPECKVVVWAHNSHVGNARATEMGTRGEFNLGQLCRDRFGSGAYLIGMGTHRGTVAAAHDWGDPMEVMEVRPSHEDSYERLCHECGVERFLLPLRAPRDPRVREGLMHAHLERAIGVIYRPETEMLSHYFQAVLPVQFDEYVWFDTTTAVHPIETEELAGVADTYPFAV